MSARPYFKFFPENWRGDPALRMCSVATRGIWIEMLCLMHEAEPYGHLLIKGLPVNPKQLALLFGAGLRETVNALAELESCGVFSKTEDGTIYSRRMVRDKERAEKGKESAERRWDNEPKPNGSPNGIPNGSSGGSPNAYSQYSIVNKPEEKVLNFEKAGKKKTWPYHGCVSKRRGTIWLQSGSSDFAAYADDYRAKNKIDPPLDDSGGYWFSIRGEGAA